MKILAVSTILVLLCATTSNAITLDEFSNIGVVSSNSPGTGETIVTSSSSAVGGFRTLYAIKNSFGAGVTRLETFADPEFQGDPDFSLGYTQGAHTGQGIITWDGNNVGTNTVTSGLGSIDLTQDDGTAIRIAIKFFDFPSTKPIDLTLRLYDSSDPSGFKYSDVTVTLNRVISSKVILEIPFTTFTTAGSTTIPAPGNSVFATSTSLGPAGAIDLKKLGAAQLILNGLSNSNAPDITLDSIATNGRCNIVPNAEGRVIDECGVCLDSQFANKGKDQCGTCLFGTANYKYSLLIDECGLCPAAADYSIAKDACGVCGGKIKDKSQCDVSENSCVTVAATKEVLKFEDRLMEQARQSLSRFRDESRRSKTNKCGIVLTQITKKVNTAFSIIRADGMATFSKGVQVCGDSCVTISYAAQVKALSTQFTTIQRITTSLANQVSQCYKKKRIKQVGGVRGNAATFQKVNAGLNQLIADCRERQVCPPK